MVGADVNMRGFEFLLPPRVKERILFDQIDVGVFHYVHGSNRATTIDLPYQAA